MARKRRPHRPDASEQALLEGARRAEQGASEVPAPDAPGPQTAPGRRAGLGRRPEGRPDKRQPGPDKTAAPPAAAEKRVEKAPEKSAEKAPEKSAEKSPEKRPEKHASAPSTPAPAAPASSAPASAPAAQPSQAPSEEPQRGAPQVAPEPAQQAPTQAPEAKAPAKAGRTPASAAPRTPDAAPAASAQSALRLPAFGEFLGVGGTDEVGASSYFYVMGRTRLLIDCGARPGGEGAAKLPDLAALRSLRPEHMLLTHAHLDHVGALPHLIRDHPHLKIHCTPQTRDLAELVMRDALKIEQLQGQTTHDQAMVDRAVTALTPDLVPGRALHLGQIEVTPHRAGHLLGAVGFRLSGAGGSVVHAGDYNLQDTPTTQGLRFGAQARAGDLQPGETDVLVTESTYGGRDVPGRDSQVMRMAAQVRQTLAAGGMVLIPSFALGRSQDVTWYLRQLMMRGVLPSVPIRLDGMVRDATRIHERHSRALPPEATEKGGQRPFTGAPVVHLDNRSRQALLDKPTAGITIASSGMLSAGASPVHARVVLEREQDLLLIVGYQDADSPGRAVQESKRGDTLRVGSGPQAAKVKVRCRVETLGISAHAGHSDVVALAQGVAPRQVVLVHGDHGARRALGQALAAGRDVALPARRQAVRLTRRA